MTKVNLEKVTQARQAVQNNWGALPIPEKSYIVIMSPRSGSTLLCVHLQNINYGMPIEAFHFSHKRLRRLYGWDIDFSNSYEHIKKALEFQTVQGIYGTKFSWIEFEIFLQKGRQLTDPTGIQLNDAELTEVFFPNSTYIHLKRRNKIKQAVSYAKAMQGGVWHIQAQENNNQKEYALPAQYDREHIESCLDNLLAFDVAWENFLQRHQLPFLELWYEDLAQNYYDKMREVYAYLGIEKGEILEPPLKKLADTGSQEWVKRFTQETPWLEDKTIKEAMEAGDASTASIHRLLMLTRQKERKSWENIPTNRFHLTGVRTFLFRLRRKLKLN
jgi:trehalose 2-sulfotransferase